MNRLIETKILADVTAHIPLVHCVVEPLDLGDAAPLIRFTGEHPGCKFEARKRFEEVPRLAHRNLSDHRRRVGKQVDEALRRQHLESLAERCSDTSSTAQSWRSMMRSPGARLPSTMKRLTRTRTSAWRVPAPGSSEFLRMPPSAIDQSPPTEAIKISDAKGRCLQIRLYLCGTPNSVANVKFVCTICSRLQVKNINRLRGRQNMIIYKCN